MTLHLPAVHRAIAQDRRGWDLLRTSLYKTVALSTPRVVTAPVFKPDGTAVFFTTSISGTPGVAMRVLTTAWNLSTFTEVGGVNKTLVGGGTGAVAGAFFKNDGTRFFVTRGSNPGNPDWVQEWSMSTPWDVSTAAFVRELDVTAVDFLPRGVVLDSTGTKMIMLGIGNDKLYSFTLSTPWDISTAVLASDKDISAQETSAESLFVRPTGRDVFISGDTTRKVRQYRLRTAWDVSTAALHASSVEIPDSVSGATNGGGFRNDGLSFLATDGFDNIFEYKVG